MYNETLGRKEDELGARVPAHIPTNTPTLTYTRIHAHMHILNIETNRLHPSPPPPPPAPLSLPCFKTEIDPNFIESQLNKVLREFQRNFGGQRERAGWVSLNSPTLRIIVLIFVPSVFAHIRLSLAADQRVCHIRMSLVTRVNALCHTYECVESQLGHKTHIKHSFLCHAPPPPLPLDSNVAGIPDKTAQHTGQLFKCR